MNYWELIADKLHRKGWSWGMVGYLTRDGRKMHAIDASRDGVRHVVSADDILAGFLELETSIRSAPKS